MGQPKLKQFEVQFARSILKYAKGNVNNIYLLLAIIAWVRKESGQRYIGNNPLNLRPGGDIAQFMSGKRKGPVGYFAVFRNLDIAAKATIRRLSVVGAWAGYKPVLAAMRRGGDQVDQARDFLIAIAKSKWSADHYGYKPATQGKWVTRELPNGSTETIWVPGKPEVMPKVLMEIWSALTGMKIPDSWFVEKVVKKRRIVKPRQPRSLQHVLPRHDYIAPYAASQFYAEVHHQGQYVLPATNEL